MANPLVRVGFLGLMSLVVAFFWTLFDASGGAAGRSEEFVDREGAEAWLGERWPNLAQSGVTEVALNEDGAEAYRMSLEEG
jgi:hypothetical protein